jgi:hypothetical protein
MSFSALASYIRPEYPQYTEDESSIGNVWHYRGPSATLVTNRPAIGDAWADGRSVRSVEYTPSLDNSAASDLIVSTVFSYADSVTIASSLDSERYQIRWVPQDLPLCQHPAFLPGGASDLYAAASGTPARTGDADVRGWEDETDNVLKGDRKYKRLVNGVPTGSAITVSIGGAPAYVKLRQLGFESFTVFLPVWTKVSVYSGTEVPGTGEAGQYVAAASVPGGLDAGIKARYPDWIKSADSAERIGTRAKWQRTEEWTGFTKVYFDTDTLNPAGHTLP